MAYSIDRMPERISIGRETETGVTDVMIDCGAWVMKWPGMALHAIHTPEGGAPYILQTETDGGVLVWHVTDADTATPGTGRMEIVGETDGQRKVSAMVKVYVAARMGGTVGHPPEAAQPWVDRVVEAAGRITGMQVQATTLDAGSSATAAWDGEQGLLTIGVPKGKDGKDGADGKDAVVDATLTKSGQAADAKVTGDAVGQLKDDKLDKTATAADASKLGGQQPSYYATAESVSNISYNNAGAHNSIYRGKNLGSAVTAAQWEEIGAGTFGDMFVGDYWYINSIYWRIGGFNYWYNYGDTACNKPHVLIVPDQNLLKEGNTAHWMNATDTTSGAYVGSDFYTGNNGNTGKAQCRSMAQSAFGSAHILTHREYLQNAVTNGYESGGAWYDSDVEIMNEKMVYGCEIFSNQTSGTNIPAKYTIDNAQIPLFALDHSRICNRAYWWLRDVVSGSYFAYVGGGGDACSYGASASWVGVRPAFAICA